MDGYAKHEKGGEFVTYARLKPWERTGSRNLQLALKVPAQLLRERRQAARARCCKDQPSKERAARSLSKRPHRPRPARRRSHPRAPSESLAPSASMRMASSTPRMARLSFLEAKWRGLQAPGKEAEMKKWPFLINNGRTNITWQSSYLDQDNEFVMDRFPYPFIQMNPQDMAELNLTPGRSGRDLQRQWLDPGDGLSNGNGEAKQTFMLFANPNGVQGNVCRPGSMS